MSELKSILYAYIKPANKAFLSKLGSKTGQSNSFCLDAMIDAMRLKREVEIPNKPVAEAKGKK